MSNTVFKFKRVNEPETLSTILSIRGKLQTAINMGVGNDSMKHAVQCADRFVRQNCNNITIKQIMRTDDIRRRSAAGMMGKVVPKPMKDSDTFVKRLLELVGV